MLRRVIAEIEQAAGPLTLAELSRRTGVEPGALDGMLRWWERRGRIEAAETTLPVSCSGTVCRDACTGLDACPYIARLPRTYSLSPPRS
jgi:hypothetical protein